MIDTADLNQAEKILSKAKVSLLLRHQTAFISSIACQMEYEFSDKTGIAETDGKTIRINPEGFCNLTKEEQVFVLAHETLHTAFSHMTRVGNKDPELYNQACDYVVNSILADQRFTLTSGALHDRRFNNMSVEEVYTILKEEQDNQDQDSPNDQNNNSGNNNQNGDGDGDGKPDPNSMDNDIDYTPPKDIKERESDILDKVIQGNQAAEAKGEGGTVPESLQRMLAEFNKPLVRWQTVLKRFMQELDKNDYSWAKPNKRTLHMGMYLPRMISDTSLSKVTFAIDTSGSISTEQFNQFVSEIYNIFKTMKPKRIDLMQFDHSLKYHKEIKSLQELKKVPFRGHGGTHPEVAIKAFMNTDSKALVVITDGEFHTNLPNPKRPVIWVVFNNKSFVPPYGKAIHFEL